jgi:hypothetical protein
MAARILHLEVAMAKNPTGGGGSKVGERMTPGDPPYGTTGCWTL